MFNESNYDFSDEYIINILNLFELVDSYLVKASAVTNRTLGVDASHNLAGTVVITSDAACISASFSISVNRPSAFRNVATHVASITHC